MRQTATVDVGRVRTAHGDAWEQLGRGRVDAGGGAIALPGIRLMSSGLPQAQWNNGDVGDPELVDLDSVRAWYAERGVPGNGVPWGLRVPVGVPWPHGRKLFTKRLMGLSPEAFRPAGARGGPWAVETAGPSDADAVLAVDTVAFESSDAVERPWVAPLLAQPAVTVAVVRDPRGNVVATGYSVQTHGLADAALYVAGIAVLPPCRRQGLASLLSSWLVQRGFAAGAQLAHLHPDTDGAAEVYRRLGFVEVPGFDIYVDMS